MGTPFISFLGPSPLNYDRSLPPSQQLDSENIPRTFLDAMKVRETVFHHEQGFALEFEYDTDDARSCHWVMYASVNQKTPPENTQTSGASPGPESSSSSNSNSNNNPTGDIPRKSFTCTVPIGTIRIVPFPHPPHPVEGGNYIDNELQPADATAAHSTSEELDKPGTPPPTTSTGITGSPALQPYIPQGDRATTYHDGVEPYVKLGRLAVGKEFRGGRVAFQLWSAARQWLETHPTFFDPSVAELGLDHLNSNQKSAQGARAADTPRWRGLVCVHAQEQIVRVYERWGFKVDPGMGRWYEEGVPHVGLFQRLNVELPEPKV